MSRRSTRRSATRQRSNRSSHSRFSAGRQASGPSLYRRPQHGRQLRLEPLEDRRLLAITVTTLADSIDLDDGVTSLREAIFAANTVPGTDTIEFDPALTASGPATILLTQGEFVISEELDIVGTGAKVLTIDALQQSRIFNFEAATGDFSISGLTLTGGRTTHTDNSEVDLYSGGAVRSVTTGTLRILRTVVEGNSTTGDESDGGGIFAANAIEIIDSQVTNCSTAGEYARGGGVATFGDLLLVDSTVSDNITTALGADSGGVVAYGDASIIRSNILRNKTTSNFTGAGGIRGRNLEIVASFISGNSTEGYQSGGGGVVGYNVVVTDSEISGNFTLGDAAEGGGINAAKVTLIRSVVRANGTAGKRAVGGGMSVVYSIDAKQSMICQNYTTGKSSGGAGIMTYHFYVKMEQCTVSQNIAWGSDSRGAGVNCAGTTTLFACTISSNFALGDGSYGGGLFCGPVNLNQSTVTGNSATNGGGGIWLYRGFVDCSNSIVARNTASDGDTDLHVSTGGARVRQSLIGHGGETNLIEAPVESPDANGNLIGGPKHGVIDPLLGPLADNGGFELPDGSRILTHALLPGSPAINAGNLNAIAGEAGVPEFDQRGEPFGRIVGGRIDIGAFEYQTPTALNLLVDTLADESDGDYSRGDLSFREAIELTNSANFEGVVDTIRFDPALTASGPATILLTQGELKITDSLTINGPGADLLTIDASGNDPTPELNNGDGSRVFYIDDGFFSAVLNVSISSLAITGADTSLSQDGGAIVARENLSISDCKIHDNATAGAGGGVNAFQSVLTIDSSVISGNTARAGGGVATNAGHLTISGSEIDGNVASERGGGVSARSTLTLIDSKVRLNIAQYGGGLYGSIVTVTGSEISQNSASLSGGGIRSEFRLTISESSIGHNSAGRSGGGVSATGVNATVTNSTIIDNSAIVAGGGVVATGALTVTGSTISRNVAGITGGGIRCSDSVTVTDTTINDNSAGNGGGINCYAGEVLITNSLIRGNWATEYGGGGVLGRSVTIVGSKITGNSSARNGGGVYSRFSIEISDSSIDGNTAGRNGGGISNESGRLTVTASTISGNHAAALGGGIFAGYSIASTVTNSTISGNSAVEGGGIRADIAPDGTFRISHSTVTSNNAELGGGLFLVNETLDLGHSIIAQNSAGVGADLTGVIGAAFTATHSLIGNNSQSGLEEAPLGSPDANGNLIGGSTYDSFIDARLDLLSDNGGPTKTHALLPSSPAINAGDPAAIAGQGGVPAHDQRGVPFTRVFGGRIDIGAVEVIPAGFLPGDYSIDGIVDAMDFTEWRNMLGQNVSPGTGADGNGDGLVDQLDYKVWKSNFGASAILYGYASIQQVVSASAIADPEPQARTLRNQTFGEPAPQPPALPGVRPRIADRTRSDLRAPRDRVLEAWLSRRRLATDDDTSSANVPSEISSDAAAVDAAFDDLLSASKLHRPHRGLQPAHLS